MTMTADVFAGRRRVPSLRYRFQSPAGTVPFTRVGRSLRLTGVRAFDRQWDVRVEDSHVTVEEA